MNDIERPMVAKFGGSSMADAEAINRVADIIRLNPARRLIVVSAPGKNSHYPQKITDLLEIASTQDGMPISNGQFNHQEHREAALGEIRSRFSFLGKQLGCDRADRWIDEVVEGIYPGNIEWAMSRGEWLMARIFASHLGAKFIDAAEIIQLQYNRHIDPVSYEMVRRRLSAEDGICVIPGFYGLAYGQSGEIMTFPRGGSDLTGAVVAKGINARIYENWTDVDGVLAVNPRVVNVPSTIECLTYEEMRELGIRGATVLQRDTILPLVEADIPINVRNTFNPHAAGSRIQAQRPVVDGEHVIGIAGEGGFMSFNIQKYGMNDEVGIGSEILQVFRIHGIPYEHSPSGRDYMSVIIKQGLSKIESERFLLHSLDKQAHPDNISVQRNLGLLSVVGQGIKDHATRVARILFSALDDALITVKAFSFGVSGISVVVAVDEERIEDAQRVAYEKFIKET